MNLHEILMRIPVSEEYIQANEETIKKAYETLFRENIETILESKLKPFSTRIEIDTLEATINKMLETYSKGLSDYKEYEEGIKIHDDSLQQLEDNQNIEILRLKDGGCLKCQIRSVINDLAQLYHAKYNIMLRKMKREESITEELRLLYPILKDTKDKKLIRKINKQVFTQYKDIKVPYAISENYFRELEQKFNGSLLLSIIEIKKLASYINLKGKSMNQWFSEEGAEVSECIKGFTDQYNPTIEEYEELTNILTSLGYERTELMKDAWIAEIISEEHHDTIKCGDEESLFEELKERFGDYETITDLIINESNEFKTIRLIGQEPTNELNRIINMFHYKELSDCTLPSRLRSEQLRKYKEELLKGERVLNKDEVQAITCYENLLRTLTRTQKKSSFEYLLSKELLISLHNKWLTCELAKEKRRLERKTKPRLDETLKLTWVNWMLEKGA